MKKNEILTFVKSSQIWKLPSHLQKEKATELLSHIDRLSEKDQSARDMIFFKANIHLRILKNYDLAERYLLEMIKQMPTYKPGYRLLVDLYFEVQSFEKSLLFIDKLMKIDRRPGQHYNRRAEINEALGNKEAAKNDKKKYHSFLEQEKWDDPNHYYHYK